VKFLSGLTSLLVIIGGLKSLAVALGANVVEAWFGSWEWLVGVSALYQIYDSFFASSGQSVKSKSQ
jgi:uncharacterized protein